jgi:phosphatidate cytidylyltransferase
MALFKMNFDLIKRIVTSLVLLPVIIYFTYSAGVYFIIFLTSVYLLSFYEIIKNTKNLLFIFFSACFLTLAFFSFYYVRDNTDYSLVLIYWILATTFLSDIGGYVFGKTFKGKKLTKISPNKTYSGSVGSIFFSLLSIPILNFLQNFYIKENLIDFYQLKFLIINISISIVCQLGDLVVSYFKRKIKIKNISNILPGHGGVLDRIDGLIFVLIFSLALKTIGII